MTGVAEELRQLLVSDAERAILTRKQRNTIKKAIAEIEALSREVKQKDLCLKEWSSQR